MPHAGNTDLEYDAALLMLSDAMPKDRRKHKTCIGIDANTQVGGTKDNDDSTTWGDMVLVKETRVDVVSWHGLGPNS